MPNITPSLPNGPSFHPIGPCKHEGKIHVRDFSGQGVINIGLEVFGERYFLVLLALTVSKILTLSLYTTICILGSCTTRHVIDSVLSCILKEKRRHDASKVET